MRLIWHIFKKDTRRLWWEVTIALALLAWLTEMDCWRGQFIPSSMEGWLNLLLPFSWSYLIALVIHEDPPVGNRQFWVTVPCRWPSLLAAKTLFVLAFIHLPYLLADAVILWARGFRPFVWIPQLLWRQLLLFAALTVPAAALAALASTVVQFMLVALLVGVAVVFLSGSTFPWLPVDQVRANLVLLEFASAALAIALLQYAHRRTNLARGLGITAALAAGALYALLPRASSAAIRCALSSSRTGAPVFIRLSNTPEPPPDAIRMSLHSPGHRVIIAIPVEVSRMPEGAIARLNPLALEVESPRGDRYQAAWPSPSEPFHNILLEAYLWPPDSIPTWQVLRMDRAIYDRIKNQSIRLKGEVVVDIYRRGDPTWMPVGGHAMASGVGKCSSAIVEAQLGEELLKVECESPTGIPRFTNVRLLDPDTGREWSQRLGDSVTWVPYPRTAWLSPLNRRDTFFHLSTEDVSDREGSRWLVPSDVMATARLGVAPEAAVGCTVRSYQISGVALSRFAVEPTR